MEAILAKKLKTWQKDFRTTHKRDPKRSDIAKVPEIAAIYETWTAVTASTGGSSSSKSIPKDKGKQKEKDTTMPPPPSTPTKKSRTISQAPIASSSSHVFKTPTKPASAQPPRTPTSSSRPANPFRTPNQGSSPPHAGPSTPRSELVLRTPPAASPSRLAAESDRPPSLDPSFHYNTSPSSFRKLVGEYATSPHRRKAAAGGLTGRGVSSIDEEMKHHIAFTPRTKARKRLRGEQVPPTPGSAEAAATIVTDSQMSPSKSRSRTERGREDALRAGPASSSASRSSSVAASERPRKKRAGMSSGRSLSSYWTQDSSAAGQAANSEGAASTSSGAGNFFQRTGSGNRAVKSSDTTQPTASSSSAVAATTKKFTSLFDDDDHASVSRDSNRRSSPMSDDSMDVDEDVSQVQNEEEEPSQLPSSNAAVAKQTQKKASRLPKQQPVLFIDGFSSEDEEPDTTSKRKPKKGQNSKTSKKKAVQQALSSEDESMNPSPGKKIYLSTYREMGTLKLDNKGRRAGHDDSDDDQGFEEDEDLFLRRLSPRKRGTVQDLSLSPPTSDEEADESLPSILPQYPGTQNPSSRHRSAFLSRQNALLSSLLSIEDGGRLAKEIQEESEAQAEARLAAATSSTNQSNDKGGRFGSNADGKQTWGGAKAANKAAAFAEKSGGPGPGKGKGRVWGGGREDGLLGKARRGMGDGLGTHLSDEEGDVGASSKGKQMTADQGRAALAARPAGSLIFKRMGRSGVDDAEDADSRSNLPSRTGEEDDDVLGSPKIKSSGYALAEDSGDEDWASDVEEDQWGWDDAGLEEDAGDVI